MTILLFLNELSHTNVDGAPNLDQEEANLLFNNLVRVIVNIRSRRSDVALVSAKPLRDIHFGDIFVFARWAADKRNRDHFRLLRAVQNRAPFRDVGPISDDGLIAYLVDGVEAHGLGYAHALDGLALSLNTSDRWDSAEINIERQEIVEGHSSRLEQISSFTVVRHAARITHVTVHDAWLSTAGLQRIRTAGQLWEARADAFPDLLFLPRVASDLPLLTPPQLKQVVDRLVELGQAVRSWRPTNTPLPEWRSKVTPEAEQRRLLCTFEDLDGERRTFDLHARFTPGAGRIHFRVDHTKQSLIVAYIGRKIEHRL
ncbi:hypothetical protein [Frankia sp. AgB32]|uniref:hypothetical protein n=1 Tax=Frankia sp. AgB32 TaxID=631119 RepID=UPI00200DF822|nr:hypothetical protein [Frankia sp. AgB32]MCK9897288.1 hypothetical protein [Frankia sp. AgB32]